MNRLRSYYILFVLPVLFLTNCKKDKSIETISDNTIPNYDGIATVIVENYVNRTFIDLIGREPLDVEMVSEVNALESSGLSEESRLNLIIKLHTDATYRPGDSSYKYAYYNRFKDLVMARMLEGASDAIINSFIGPLAFGAQIDSINGNWQAYNEKLAEITKLENLKTIGTDYLAGDIDVKDIFRRALDNNIYDEINMNSFNFINACYDDLYDRFPSDEEFDKSYEMVEYSNSASIYGQNGSNKEEYINIITDIDEFYEGIIHWQYNSLLARNATSSEVFKLLPTFKVDKNIQTIQLEIMKSDEYANFD